ncbi:autotransporter outer membrane beta-barrel domain-containing protein [Lysobacter capsici]|uniref:autotransporter outer membrane beta-barrel domain-containing protein n=1 Tax=Lysobacter capsici TaxID=435897 RepID=UPI001C0057F9|nr:autotransporter outer membrane beta-barrel domain-containing protein [Lysobacter capsici]QWF18835.1 autotransporter domain-containing protein [Lysobacter capsici]
MPRVIASLSHPSDRPHHGLGACIASILRIGPNPSRQAICAAALLPLLFVVPMTGRSQTSLYWDGGNPALHDNGSVDTGPGTWDSLSRSWTQADGAVNSSWTPGAIAVFSPFQSADINGEQIVAGLRFIGPQSDATSQFLRSNPGGSLRFDSPGSTLELNGRSVEISATLTGNGDVTISNGTLALYGINTLSGGMTVRNTTLSISNGASLGAASNVVTFDGSILRAPIGADIAAVRSDQRLVLASSLFVDGNLVLNGDISGPGGLVKGGTFPLSTVTLNGHNTYTGGTIVASGTLIGNASSIRGPLEVRDLPRSPARVIFDQAEDGVYDAEIVSSNNMSGPDASLNKQGAGKLTLTARSTGFWGISAGTLVADPEKMKGGARIDPQGTLRLEKNGDGVFSGSALIGSGRLELASTGIITLASNLSRFGGTAYVEKGETRLGGTQVFGGNLLVGPGAKFAGPGLILGSIENRGVIAVGQDGRALTINNDYTHLDGASFDVTIAAEGAGSPESVMKVFGKAVVQGGDVRVTKVPGQYADSARYILIEANGGLQGQFKTLAQDMPFLNLQLAYDSHYAYLDIVRNTTDFSDVCSTFNQCEMSRSIDAISRSSAPGSDLKTVLREFTTLSVPAALAGLNSISGETHASAASLALENESSIAMTMSNRIIAAHRAPVSRDKNLWVHSFDVDSKIDGDANASGADNRLHGLGIGVDTWLGERWFVGASLSTSRAKTDMSNGDDGKVDSKALSLYTGGRADLAYWYGGLSYSRSDNKFERRIQVGDIRRRADSDYDGDRIGIYLEGGLDFRVGNSFLTPLISIERARVKTDGFREVGADDLNLVVSSHHTRRTTVSAGLAWTGSFARGGWTFEPNAQLRWLHGIGDLHAQTEVALAGAPDFPSRARGVSWPKNRGMAGLGITARQNEKLDVSLEYGYQHSDRLESNNWNASLQYRW